MNVLFISILVLLLFFVSGFEKIFNFDSTVNSFIKNTGVSTGIAKIGIIVAIIIEILVPLITWYELYTKKEKYSKYALGALVIFTVIATAIYHKDDTSGILKNLSVIGGILFLMNN